ncbi:TRIM71 [Mytilus edulis]|uniref:TRIM71 n=1 Tax=Mytilus edulis TaxID=6550 RepID=A0A8S3SWQ2_MYTED|nr:TRIM71 [Mytilus edulis]
MAQNLMVCQFCETSNEPKYKCVNCDLILCEGCKIKIHTKIKKTEVHQVLDLKEFSNLGASETIRHLDLKDIQCSIHNAEHCIIYCEDCKVLLCAVCLLESHQTHTLAKISEVYHKKESELIENITKQRDNLITELDKLWKPREDKISKQLTDTAEKCDALARKKAQIEETFQSHNATAIFTASGKLNNDLPTRPVNTISEQKLLFSETRNLEDTKEVFGSVLISPECKITGSFTLDTKDGIWSIQTLENKTNILCPSGETTIKSFKLTDSKCETTTVAKDEEELVIDTSKTNNNKLLFTVGSSSEIKSLSTFTPDSCLVTCLNESHGIEKPVCLNIDQSGQLQIGCSGKDTKSGLSKILTLDISS